VLTFAGGVLLFVRRDAVEAAQARLPSIVDADLLYRRTMRGLDRLAVLVTGATQRGSLPLYLASVLLVVVFVPGSWLLRDQPWPQSWRAWDTALQPLVAALVAVGAFAATRLRQRVSAVLLVGVTGYGTGVLFVIHGAPDLALTQFLVETLTLVIFVLVLRKLPKRIVERHTPRERVLRLLLAVPAGVLVAAFGVVALAARTAEPISTAFPPLAYSFGGGKNVVNVTLVDIRAWDTIGEISVLVVAATGVAASCSSAGAPGRRRGWPTRRSPCPTPLRPYLLLQPEACWAQPTIPAARCRSSRRDRGRRCGCVREALFIRDIDRCCSK
jgi:multicomponent Na+:H+ antiporter subunit A